MRRVNCEVHKLKPHYFNTKLYGEEDLEDAFLKSVRENGILVPLTIKPDGTIISGHRRWQAAVATGLKYVPVEVKEYETELDEREAIIDFNRQREKTFSQKMAEAEELEVIERERAEKRMLAGKSAEPYGNISVGFKGETRDKVASKIGIGTGRTYDKAKKVWEAAKKDEQARKWVEDIDKGKQSISSVYRNLKRINKKNDIKKIDPQKLEGKYNVIYADPPWRYNNNSTSIRGTADDHYPTMELEEIKKIPVKDITLENAALFLWTTSSMIIKAFEVIEAWGFEFKTSMVWVKNTIGNGFFVRGKHEILLIATKGSFLPMTTDLPESVVFAKKEGHSKKPEVFYEIIEKMYPEQKYIELFARQKRENWHSWGNEL